MKLSDDTLISLGQILAGNSDPHNSEICKLQHNNVCGVVLSDWYFLFSSRLRFPKESPNSIAIDESESNKCDIAPIVMLRFSESDTERIIAVPLTDRQPIAFLLDRWGEPPANIQIDWRQQLASHSGNREILFYLTSEDGEISRIPNAEKLSITDGENTELQNRDWKMARWPWEGNLKTTSDAACDVLPLDSSADEPTASFPDLSSKPLVTIARQKSLPNRSARNFRTTLWIAGSFFGLLMACVLLPLFWQPNVRLTELPTASESTVEDPKSSTTSSAVNSATTDATPSVELDTLERIELNQNSLVEKAELLAHSSDLDKLLMQGADSDGMLSNSIIETSLSSSTELTMTPMMDSDPKSVANDSEMEESSTPKLDAANPNDESSSHNLDAGIERTLVLSNSTIKDRIAIGQKLLSKDGQCSATLQLHEDDAKRMATVIPEGSVSILGNGVHTWTIGIEDSEPDLVVQLQSKPGRRWDLLVMIGFREEKSQTHRLLAPGNAKTVVNRLIAAKQAIVRLLEQNQLARDSGVRGGVDLSDQRRQLQRQQKEIDKTLERWITIEKLSYLVFDHAKLVVNLEHTPAK